ncbi:hypothetical protein VNO78_10389 [Psophocarpus tetragonolobus]|uniref:Uncharacterized protein n=1 Tax=Psophocarpus tetragonolobus TaxID=3891 RepID=A0AAN9SLY8_PSOTE
MLVSFGDIGMKQVVERMFCCDGSDGGLKFNNKCGRMMIDEVVSPRFREFDVRLSSLNLGSSPSIQSHANTFASL